MRKVRGYKKARLRYIRILKGVIIMPYNSLSEPERYYGLVWFGRERLETSFVEAGGVSIYTKLIDFAYNHIPELWFAAFLSLLLLRARCRGQIKKKGGD